MAELKVLNDAGQQASTVEAPDALFAREYLSIFIKSPTCTLPERQKRDKSFLPKSTSIKCSARSFWFESNSSASRMSSFSSEPLRRVPAITQEPGYRARSAAWRRVRPTRANDGLFLLLPGSWNHDSRRSTEDH